MDSADNRKPQPDPGKAKNPAAVALGRLGGLKGGKAAQAGKTPLERSEAARWGKRLVNQVVEQAAREVAADPIAELLVGYDGEGGVEL